MDKKEIKVRILTGISIAAIFGLIYFISHIKDKQIEKKIGKSALNTNIVKPNNKQKHKINCDEFNNGYKNVLWNWDKYSTINYFNSQEYKLESESIYSTPEGRSALSLHFRKGLYSDYRSEHQMKERFINFVNDSIYQIEFLNYFNWNYNFQMAYDVAKDVADKYNLPKRSDQTVGFGARNIVWYDDCPDFRVIVRLFWDPNVIDGEANRYLAVEIFNVAKDNEFKEIQDIVRIKKRKKKMSDFSKDL